MAVVIAPIMVAAMVLNSARRRREEEKRASHPREPMTSDELRWLMEDMERDRIRRENRIVHPIVWMIIAAILLMAVVVGTVCLILTLQGAPLPPLTREGFLRGTAS